MSDPLFESPPLVAVNWREISTSGREEEAENSISWVVSAASVKGDCGDDAIPSGKLLNATITDPLNPFSDATEMTAGGLVVPTAVERTEGLTLKLKSGCGWFEELELLPPPPQLAIEREIAQRIPHNANLNLSNGDSHRTRRAAASAGRRITIPFG